MIILVCRLRPGWAQTGSCNRVAKVIVFGVKAWSRWKAVTNGHSCGEVVFRFERRCAERHSKNGTWPTTFVSPAYPGVEVHWHSEDVCAYVMEGETSFFDGESGDTTRVGPGDKVTIPKRTLHAEGEVKDRVVYVIGMPEPLLSQDFLKIHRPDEL